MKVFTHNCSFAIFAAQIGAITAMLVGIAANFVTVTVFASHITRADNIILICVIDLLITIVGMVSVIDNKMKQLHTFDDVTRVIIISALVCTFMPIIFCIQIILGFLGLFIHESKAWLDFLNKSLFHE